MSQKIINISFPVNENILLLINQTKERFTQEVLYLTALFLWRKRKLSLGKASELAGYNKIEFIEKLQRDGEYIFDYNEEELDEIFEDAGKLV
jgi:predicted HTH domain antitoxin